jgi:hypothetical protein
MGKRLGDSATTIESSGDPYLDELVARIDAGTLAIGQAVIQYAQTLGIEETTAAQIVAIALGAEREESL